MLSVCEIQEMKWNFLFCITLCTCSFVFVFLPLSASGMQGVGESAGGRSFAGPHIWVDWKHSHVAVKTDWIRFIKISWCCFWKSKLFFSPPKEDKIGHCRTLLQSAVVVEMFFTPRDTSSWQQWLCEQSGDVRTSPRNAGPQAAPHACCWSHCGHDVVGRTQHQRGSIYSFYINRFKIGNVPLSCM